MCLLFDQSHPGTGWRGWGLFLPILLVSLLTPAPLAAQPQQHVYSLQTDTLQDYPSSLALATPVDKHDSVTVQAVVAENESLRHSMNTLSRSNTLLLLLSCCLALGLLLYIVLPAPGLRNP